MTRLRVLVLVLVLGPAAVARADERSVGPAELAAANDAARPGDVLLLRGGSYAIPIRPALSGETGRPIVYRAAPGETPLFTGLDLAVDLRGRSHVTIEGIAVEKVGRFLWAEDSAGLSILRCRFGGSTAWESCRLKRCGDGLQFVGNTFRDGTDLLSIQGGAGHLVADNAFHTASHTCLVLMGVQRSVIRGNRLSNPVQKLMEVFATRRKDWPGATRLSTRLVIEGNAFDLAAGKDGNAGIQFAGDECLIRRNVFRRCGMGVDFTTYKSDPEEAWSCRRNRFVHNTLVDCGGAEESHAAVRLAPAMPDFEDQVIANNLIWRSARRPAAGSRAPPSVLVAFTWDAIPSHARLLGNLINDRASGDPVLFWLDAKGKKTLSLREFESAFQNSARGNLEGDPLLEDSDAGDFRLWTGSPCVDAGLPLTRTRSAGSGRGLEVEDALPFAEGDPVRIGGARARVLTVDPAARRLALDRDLSWPAGAPVGYDYEGAGPDVGAFERLASGR
ncbi:MAG: right-handed parallel beta-helix repeat-containing protein [Planctomycetales bacterium]|nr:right-handed parallel beta-helix repeat-containing protein [Planctomycetales bacterium]